MRLLGLGAVLTGSLVAVTWNRSGPGRLQFARGGHPQPGAVSPRRQCGGTAQRDGGPFAICNPPPVNRTQLHAAWCRRGKLLQYREGLLDSVSGPRESRLHRDRCEAEAGATTAPRHELRGAGQVHDTPAGALAPVSWAHTRCSRAPPPARPATCSPAEFAVLGGLAGRSSLLPLPRILQPALRAGLGQGDRYSIWPVRCLPTTSMRVGDTQPLAAYVTATSATLAVSYCQHFSCLVFPNFIRAPFDQNYTGRNESGSYYVRAVDWAGNQDKSSGSTFAFAIPAWQRAGPTAWSESALARCGRHCGRTRRCGGRAIARRGCAHPDRGCSRQ